MLMTMNSVTLWFSKIRETGIKLRGIFAYAYDYEFGHTC